ncbi:hypothetical protein BOFE_10690 (plasmid) [Candidatus Borrelia fainii]|uniref:Lipoprotein n=1 Tax=Candidatus Borrelia fainii TaxID=2518322 RepID=A0ABM8DLV1_9SPIR|nr:hypothetical protein [Candidatus Borrelia fainii]BDU63529.1 hypothetical protein BOFE_10690 [Candidatus Borrelia fainii]
MKRITLSALKNSLIQKEEANMEKINKKLITMMMIALLIIGCGHQDKKDEPQNNGSTTTQNSR